MNVVLSQRFYERENRREKLLTNFSHRKPNWQFSGKLAFHYIPKEWRYAMANRHFKTLDVENVLANDVRIKTRGWFFCTTSID
jgi:hypothetical protein